MAPATQSDYHSFPTLVSRQSSEAPTCARYCIISGNTTECPGGAQDLVCLCQSQVFLSSVTDCVTATCEGDMLQQAVDYAAYTCSLYGIDIPATTIGSPAATTSIAAPVNTAPIAPIIDKTQVTSKIDIIMGSVCAVFLAIAFAVGFYGCFKRNKINKEEASRTNWTQTGSVTSPTFNPAKSYNAFDIPANFDPTRSFGGTAAHQTQSVGRVAIPGLGMRDLTHLDPRDVRMPNEPPRSAFGRSVNFADKDADLFRDDDYADEDMVDEADRLRTHLPRLSNRDALLEDDDEITGLDSDRVRPSTFVSNRLQPAESLHTLGESEKDDQSPTYSDTRFVVNTLEKGDGRRVSVSTTGSDEKQEADIWGRAK